MSEIYPRKNNIQELEARSILKSNDLSKKLTKLKNDLSQQLATMKSTERFESKQIVKLGRIVNSEYNPGTNNSHVILIICFVLGLVVATTSVFLKEDFLPKKN